MSTLVLADTSVWVDFLRRRGTAMEDLLAADQTAMHDLVIGELAMGNVRGRRVFLSHIRSLSRLRVASTDEVLTLVESRQLFGRGLGWIDAHLLAGAMINECRLWTRDRALGDAASELGLAWTP